MGVVCRPNQHVVGVVLHIRWLTQSVCGRTHVPGYCTKVLLNLERREGVDNHSKFDVRLYTTVNARKRTEGVWISKNACREE